jgi:hypothetical protein
VIGFFPALCWVPSMSQWLNENPSAVGVLSVTVEHLSYHPVPWGDGIEAGSEVTMR